MNLRLKELIESSQKMKTALEEIREIYTGADGFIPETCPEGYLQRLMKQMYEAAVNGLST